jgi:hypothetical protein
VRAKAEKKKKEIPIPADVTVQVDVDPRGSAVAAKSMLPDIAVACKNNFMRELEHLKIIEMRRVRKARLKRQRNSARREDGRGSPQDRHCVKHTDDVTDPNSRSDARAPVRPPEG